jgi:hypothetical protein
LEESRHNLFLILLSILFITNTCSSQKDCSAFQEYNAGSPEEITVAIRNDLASNDPSRRDKAIMFLSFLINTSQKSQKEHEAVLKLAGDSKIISIASEIVAERFAGWYEERESTQEKSMPMYYPLIHLLSLSKSKTAQITLLMALPIVGFDTFFRKSVFSSGLSLKTALSRLTTIENKLCCIYPGREPICDMQAIDFRLTMLRLYLEAANDKGLGVLSTDIEIKKFIAGCLEFGDENKGRIIRTMAVEIACILIKTGQKEFLTAVKKIAESDPCYLYRVVTPAENNSLPLYDSNGRYYPVREKARKELSQLSGL